jgi:hypothetical protein
MPAGVPVTDEIRARILELRSQGWTQKQIGDDVGITNQGVGRILRRLEDAGSGSGGDGWEDRPADPTPKVDWSKAVPPKPSERPPDPKPRNRPPKRKRRPSTPELEKVLAELLVLPAIPARAALHCDYCMMHFLTEGPKAAHELAVLADDNPALRSLLERVHGAMTAVGWASVIGLYLGKPVLHHLAPEPMLTAVGPVLSIPPRPEREPHRHGRPHPPATAQEPVAA